jgi:hypothetical protein
MMDKQTSDALEASIQHWEENIAAETPDDVLRTDARAEVDFLISLRDSPA